MAPQKQNNGIYVVVPQEEHDHSFKEASFRQIYDEVGDESTNPFPPKRRKGLFRNWMHWAAHLLLSFTLLLSIFTSGFQEFMKKTKRGSMIRPAEEFYQDVNFLSQTKSSYLDNNGHIDEGQRKWKGRPNEENERLWQTLSDVGVVSIKETEARRLGVRTARNIGAPDEFVIAPLVYHELHCLSMYRSLLWKAADRTLDLDEEMQDHHDHCIHTLRQSLMCNANLSPLTFTWKDYKIDYLTTWNAPMQCRNWDSIQAWASMRNTSGMHTTIRADPEETKRRLEELESHGARMPWEYLF